MALSKGDKDEALERRLAAFSSSASALFESVGFPDGTYFNYGYFAVPLRFQGAGPRRLRRGRSWPGVDGNSPSSRMSRLTSLAADGAGGILSVGWVAPRLKTV